MVQSMRDGLRPLREQGMVPAGLRRERSTGTVAPRYEPLTFLMAA
jgi:hypothetical protein